MAANVRLLIVEGSSDRWFLRHLLERNGFEVVQTGDTRQIVVRKAAEAGAPMVRIVAAGGFGKIGKAIRDEYRPDEMTGLGIVADQDLRGDGRAAELGRILEAAGFGDVSRIVPADGLIVGETPLGCVGVWLMPDNVREGMTETFAAELLGRAADPAWAYAERVVDEMPADARRFDLTRHSAKAKVHTWLAWQEDPDGSLGNAVHRGDLAVNGELVVRFCRWMEQWLAAGSGGGVG